MSSVMELMMPAMKPALGAASPLPAAPKMLPSRFWIIAKMPPVALEASLDELEPPKMLPSSPPKRPPP